MFLPETTNINTFAFIRHWFILSLSLGDGALFQYGKIEITLGSKAGKSQIRNYLAFSLKGALLY